MSTSKNRPDYTKEQYLESWGFHLGQLKRIRPSNPDDAAAVEDIMMKLSVIIDREANALFPEITCGACTVAIGAHTYDANCSEESTS